jgi:hypothetical protein
MSLNQYAVFQLKRDTSTKPMRYKSYKHVIENNISVVSDNYHQVYITPMIQDTTPEEIRGQLEKKLPSKFKGNALNVSDVIAITKDGVTSAYYVDISGMVMIPGFFRMNSSTAMITMQTKGFVFDDRKGSWMASDETIIDGKQFFLMESETYGWSAAYAVVDDQGRKVAEDTYNGFDDRTIQQIRNYLNAPQAAVDHTRTQDGKIKLEIYQQFFENGEYLRSVESGTEQNYNMIDGVANNKGSKPTIMKQAGKAPAEEDTFEKKAIPRQKNHPKKRQSVLQRLREKQDIVAANYGSKAPDQEKEEVERNRK